MQNNYLKEVQLSGYKTIKNTSIDFAPGLNIIIGRNGVGKTNFIEFLHGIIDYNSTLNISNSKALLSLVINNKNHKIFFEKTIVENSIPEKIIDRNLERSQVTKYKYKSKNFDSSFDLLIHLISKEKIILSEYLIKHGIIYDDLIFLNYYPNIVIDIVGSTHYLSENEFLFKDFVSYFSHKIQSLLKIITLKENKYLVNISEEKLKNYIADTINSELKEVSKILKRYSSIEGVRINDSFSVFYDKKERKIIIKNIYYEFNIEDSWITFSNLSDGTKRVLLIISQIQLLIESDKNNETTKEFDFLYSIFIEEPELGLHPHQLFNLMQYIKQASEQCQIIITTHSPDVLDVLTKNDLNRLIIAEYDSERGTTLRHLNNDEKAKATNYITEDGFLSSYWKYSDLEKN